MSNELDFSTEASNLTRVASNLVAACLPASVPVPLLASRRALVMTFEEGFKITDTRALALHGVDTSALMARVVAIYAQVGGGGV
jgi:predicted unusual protein kinase regulating ubiquinone biosynthesis (AarF/ABC1/UbiB family)